MSSPLMSCCRSNVRLFGATYSAQAASIDWAMNEDNIGIFITFGKDSAIGITEIDTRGRPISVINEVFMLKRISYRGKNQSK